MNHTPTTDLTDDTTHILTWLEGTERGTAREHKEYHSDGDRAFHRALQLNSCEGVISVTISQLT